MRALESPTGTHPRLRYGDRSGAIPLHIGYHRRHLPRRWQGLPDLPLGRHTRVRLIQKGLQYLSKKETAMTAQTDAFHAAWSQAMPAVTHRSMHANGMPWLPGLLFGPE